LKIDGILVILSLLTKDCVLRDCPNCDISIKERLRLNDPSDGLLKPIILKVAEDFHTFTRSCYRRE